MNENGTRNPFSRQGRKRPGRARQWRIPLIIAVLAAALGIPLFRCSREPSRPPITKETRLKTDSLIRSARGIDSLTRLQFRLESEGDRLGSVVALRELGRLFRNESRFDEAVDTHLEGLRQAEEMGDTLEWVQALNNVGTDYRRQGVLDVALEYHSLAKAMCDESRDTSTVARKNRVVSLNGLGNIYLSMGDHDNAAAAFLLALADEKALGSDLGQAINHANLGSIFQTRGQEDSAWFHHRRSMQFNRKAGSQLGISLCHINFGSLYENAGMYAAAQKEYEAAYELMEASKDEWHALNSLIAMARIRMRIGDRTRAMDYLSRALSGAERLRSLEHLEEIHMLYSRYHRASGDWRGALESYEKAMETRGKAMDMAQVNRLHNTALKIERSRRDKQAYEARVMLERERARRRKIFALFGMVSLFFVVLILAMLYWQRVRERRHLSLKKAGSLRDRFFSNITHEFRTPLTIILGMSEELLRHQSVPPQAKEMALTIERQGRGMLSLVNQLMDISKVKSEAGDPDWRDGDITAYLSMIMESWREWAASRKIRLQFHADGPVVMDFVPDYMNKLMGNLLSNAFKFTPEHGQVDVTARRKGDWFLIDVKDTGKGMDEETLSRAFDRFYQAESDGGQPGTGIGLALVKQIMDSIDGTVTAESAPGKGTVFHLRLPVRSNSGSVAWERDDAVPATHLPAAALSDSEGGDNDLRLLVIEDNRDVALFIGQRFTDKYAVSYAADGKEGFQKALELIPDLIITDLTLPAMDGLELCRMVRGNDLLNHIPIIVVTARLGEQERINSIEAGADDYLPKPFSGELLAVKVEKLLEERRVLREKYLRMSIENAADEKEAFTALRNKADIEFLSKLTDSIYRRLDQKKETGTSVLAADMFMSASKFYRKVTSLTGHSPVAYLQRVKIKKARSLIDSDPGISFADVAELCGFKDYSNFVRAFKNVMELTPTEYRKNKTLD